MYNFNYMVLSTDAEKHLTKKTFIHVRSFSKLEIEVGPDRAAKHPAQE